MEDAHGSPFGAGYKKEPLENFFSQSTPTTTTMTIDSASFFGSHWMVWRILGLTPQQMSWPRVYLGGSLLMHLLFTLGYPFHLGMAVFRNANLTDDIKNLTIFATCFACSLKFAIYAYKFEKVQRIEELLQLLDARVRGEAQIAIYNQLRTQLRMVLYAFIGIYMPCALFAELAFIYQDERGLMYPAWFPLDWRNSTRNFYIVNVYQIIGVTYQLLQNYVSDCFPAVVLCLISAHIKMLYLRFEAIGVGDSLPRETHAELEACITDHKHLLE